jgi:hypothetical protein
VERSRAGERARAAGAASGSPWPLFHPQNALVGKNVGNSPILCPQTRIDARGWITLRVTFWLFEGRPDLSESVRNHPITRWYPAGFSLFWLRSTSGRIRPNPALASEFCG